MAESADGKKAMPLEVSSAESRRTSTIRPKVDPASVETPSQPYRSRSPTLSGFPPPCARETPPPSSVKARSPSAPPSSAPPPAQQTSKTPSGRPRKYISVEMVGVKAMDLARDTRRTLTPRVIASHDFLLLSPIGGLEFFLIGFVNGKRTEGELCELTGWSREDVHEGLERLVRLGIIAFDYV